MDIEKQVIATTHKDSHGEKLTKDELFGLYESLSKEMILNNNHDLSLPPIAVASNLTFEKMNSSEWAIFADVSVFDKEAFVDKGGFSISWLADLFTLNPECQPDLEIYFNPRYFTDDDALDLVRASSKTSIINTRQLKQKGAESAIILILKFVSVSALAGFFGKIGADAYDALKTNLLGIAKDKRNAGKDVGLHLVIPDHLNPLNAEILLELPSELIKYTEAGVLDFENAVNIVEKLPYSGDLKKVALSASGEPPAWRVNYYIKADGMVVKI